MLLDVWWDRNEVQVIEGYQASVAKPAGNLINYGGPLSVTHGAGQPHAGVPETHSDTPRPGTQTHPSPPHKRRI